MEPSRIKVLIVDNYDSFTYNVAHSVRKLPSANIQIIEADNVRLSDIGSFDKIIFSPGPDLPRPGNIMEKILAVWGQKKSILGICLGLQAIWLFYGGKLTQLEEVVHGRKKQIIKTAIQSKILYNLPQTFEAGLYHSWVADADYQPEEISITAISGDGRIMAVRHNKFDIEAVQFHPESVMTPLGDRIIMNWLDS